MTKRLSHADVKRRNNEFIKIISSDEVKELLNNVKKRKRASFLRDYAHEHYNINLPLSAVYKILKNNSETVAENNIETVTENNAENNIETVIENNTENNTENNAENNTENNIETVAENNTEYFKDGDDIIVC